MKQTPLYQQHVALGGKIVDFAGYALPIRYSSITEEHEAVRQAVGLFDVSHMGEIQVKGPDAEDFLNYLVTNSVSGMTDGQIVYSPMCYDHGGTVDDLLIYRQSKDTYLLVVNGSNITKDYEWITSHKRGKLEILNMSESLGLIALQGPQAEGLLSQICDCDLSHLSYYHFLEDVALLGSPVLISRTGYTGEDGFEIMARSEDMPKYFDALLNAGAKPCGLGARDTLRFEAAMPLYGHELTEDISPKASGLSYFIKKEVDFIGSEALKEPVTHKIVGIEVLGKGIAREGYDILSEAGKKIGHVTTGYKSPTLDRVLALGYIEKDYSALGSPLKIQIRNKQVDGQVISKRFYKRQQ